VSSRNLPAGIGESRLQVLKAQFLERMKWGCADEETGEPFIRPFYFLTEKKGKVQASNADGADPLAAAMATRLGVPNWSGICENLGSRSALRCEGAMVPSPLSGQACGSEFEKLVIWFLRQTLSELAFMRPGDYRVERGGPLKNYVQYRHLRDFDQVLSYVPDARIALKRRLAAAFSSYAVKPDIVVSREPISRVEVEEQWAKYFRRKRGGLFDASVSQRTPILRDNVAASGEILHAIVSAKWTLRSDRAQNARTEGAFSARERRGHAPHLVVVTGESKPSRIRSLAEGADIDCVYHFDVDTLVGVVEDVGGAEEREKLAELSAMNRLRDLSDLPFDLII